MARETRRQRRDARRGSNGGQGGGIAGQPRVQTAGASDSGDGGGTGGTLTAPSLAQPGDRRHFSFLREVVAELRKVEWPNRAQVIQGTVVVIVACTVVGAFLYACDLVLRPFVQHVLLGQ